METSRRAAQVRLIAFDIDGVMTDGRLFFTDEGQEFKAFNTLDGFGLKTLMDAGILVAIITGRSSPAVLARAKNLHITEVYQGVENKLDVLNTLRLRQNLDWEACAFMGDDLIDLPCMLSCGFAAAPANAYPLVRQKADWISTSKGGEGAVREVCDFILAAKGELQQAQAAYLLRHPESQR